MESIRQWIARRKAKKQPTQRAEDLLRVREGTRTRVYKDSRGNLTVGIGHKITAKDDLAYGDVIPPEQVESLFAKDVAKARALAEYQAEELGIKDVDFIEALVSVNFQLGGGWYLEHKKTWKLLKERKYKEAAQETSRSRWAHQTPIRVKDFQTALLKLQGEKQKGK